MNAQFKDHKEINNSSHLCFPFVTRTLSDLTSFTINFLEDQNEKNEFKSGEKKNVHIKLSNRCLFDLGKKWLKPLGISKK